jgi:hypothetical protein
VFSFRAQKDHAPHQNNLHQQGTQGEENAPLRPFGMHCFHSHRRNPP